MSLLSPQQGEGGAAREIYAKALSEAVDADAYAILKMLPGKGAVRILGGTGLRIPRDKWAKKLPVLHRSGRDMNLTQVKAVILKGPFESGSFLEEEGAREALLMRAASSDEYLAAIALRRSTDAFSRAEVERFTAVAGVVNMARQLRNTFKGCLPGHAMDSLTGLGLFSEFHESMVKELSRARRNGRSATMGIMTVLSRDPEHAEDAILRVAKTFKERLRNFDTLDRYGAAELAFILPELSSGEGVSVLERVRGEIVESLGGQDDAPDIYIGLSCYPEDGASVERLIEMAEAAVNQAVEGAKPGVCRWKE